MNTMLKTKLVLLSLLLGVSFSFAQSNFNPNEELPLNPKARYGVLENGITYYVVHNEEPKERASFYIVQNVGAILENDNQNGLAHFLEHMAFNGTENFPEKGILEYLESNGVAFGRNINAYTSVDETVYNISSVPTTNENLIDSTLLVLHDWSDYLLLTDEEIDSERGVIHEEWRTRRSSGAYRMYMESRKYILEGSKYTKRDVIGDLNVIDSFEYQTIKDFYRDWYRTDLQAIVIVGDLDVDKIETRIKELFGEIKPIENPKERKYFEIEKNTEPIVGVVTDPEAGSIKFNAYVKHDATKFEDKNMGYYREKVLAELYSSMIGMRYNEMLQKGNPPFIYAYAAYHNQARLLDVYNVGVGIKEDNIIGGIEAALIENERVLQHGFLTTELERAKTALFSGYEKAYKERNKMNNDKHAGEYNNHYLTNEPAPGIEFEFELIQKLLPGIAVDEINVLAKNWNTNENRVYVLAGIEKDGLTYPTKEEILQVSTKVKSIKVDPYEDSSLDEPLVSTPPTPGKVLETKELSELGSTEWTLENGAKVIIKTTDFKENEILLNAYSKGGSSLYDAKDLPSIDMLGSFIPAFGVGNFDNVNLEKKLTGKIVKYSPSVSELYESVSGSSSIEDFETLLKLVYLQFEFPRYDEEAFGALKARYTAYVANMSADVNKAFGDTISMVKADYSERNVIFNAENIEKVDYETIKRVFGERFVDASDFTFVFVGNIDAEEVKPLIETYIGGIKATDRTESWKDNKVGFPEQDVEKHFAKQMQTPKTSIYINLHGEGIEYNAQNRILMDFVSELLDKKYMDIIREQEGGSYGVRVGGRVTSLPTPEYQLIASFDTDPEKAEKLKGIIYAEIKNLYEQEIDEVDMEEARTNFIKKREESLRKNKYWMGAIMHYSKHNEIIVTPDAYEDIVNSVTKEQIQEFAKKYLSGSNKVEVVMSPAE